MSNDAPVPDPQSTVTDVGTLCAGDTTAGYREFLRVPAMSAGLFTAPPGHIDTQTPHAEDEVYVVVAGEGVLEVDGHSRPVAAGSIAYVPAGVEHRFVDISAELQVFVVFSPPES